MISANVTDFYEKTIDFDQQLSMDFFGVADPYSRALLERGMEITIEYIGKFAEFDSSFENESLAKYVDSEDSIDYVVETNGQPNGYIRTGTLGTRKYVMVQEFTTEPDHAPILVAYQQH